MGLFRRSQPDVGPHPVTAFWSWWASEGHDISPHETSPMTDTLTRLVAAIHPDLTWHFSKGEASEHRLTVSAGGIAAVRPAAERWQRSAVPADATWEFRSSQQADPDALSQILEIGGHRVALDQTMFRLEVDHDSFRVHVGVFHPSFPDLRKATRQQITYLVLDWLAGEDDVERWFGHIETLVEAPAAQATAADLLAAVATIAALRDTDQWTIAEGRDDNGSTILALFRRGLRWIDTPTLDRHQIVSVQYVPQANGLPSDARVLDQLRTIEAELESVVGPGGTLVGHESCSGTRTFHVYTDGEDQNIEATVLAWAHERGVTVVSRTDPAWSEVRHFTG